MPAYNPQPLKKTPLEVEAMIAKLRANPSEGIPVIASCCNNRKLIVILKAKTHLQYVVLN